MSERSEHSSSADEVEPARRLLDEEESLRFDAFDNDTAWALGCQLVEWARERSLAVTIDISRGQQQLFHAALPGTCADFDDWLQRKTRTVQRFGHSSYYVGQRRPFDGQPHLDPRSYTDSGGGFPITVRGVGVVGVVAVSGLSGEDDHGMIVSVLTRFLGSLTRPEGSTR